MSDRKIFPENLICDLNDADAAYLSIRGIEVGNYGCIYVYDDFEKVNDHIILGYDQDAPICVTNSGVVVIEPGLTRFVNSSVEKFHLSIQAFSKYSSKVVLADNDKEELRIVREAIAELHSIDNFAWSNENNYWPIIGAKMIEGNL